MSGMRWWLTLAALVLSACSNDMLGIDVCGKLCDVSDDCGDGLDCVAGTCACGTTAGVADGGGSGAASSGSSTVSSGMSASRAASSSGGTSASSAAGSTSSVASSGVTVSSGSGSLSSSAGASSASSGVLPSSSLITASSSAGPVDAGAPDAAGPCTAMAAGAPCGSGMICNASEVCVSGCFVAGVVQAPGPDPANTCQLCAPSTSTTAWVNAPATDSCEDMDLCTNPDACNGMGVCVGTPRCPATTPACTPAPFNCACTTSPVDSCATGTTNKRCVGTACGCMDNTDCAAGFACAANNRCAPCTSTTSCGLTCENCRTLPMSIDEGEYYQCSSNLAPLATACMVTACSATRADCNGVDMDACEVSLQTSTTACGQCAGDCAPTFICNAGQCECDTNADCPAGQTCGGGGRCRCSTGTCSAGYVCNNFKCVRQ